MTNNAIIGFLVLDRLCSKKYVVIEYFVVKKKLTFKNEFCSWWWWSWNSASVVLAVYQKIIIEM